MGCTAAVRRGLVVNRGKELDEFLEAIGILADAVNEVLGYPICAVRCEHNGSCTLATGHEGQHDSDGNCQWENDNE
jgi:hypothetical protein